MAPLLFTPIELRSLTLNNRIVIAPMCQYAADEGSATDWHLMHLGQFAMGAAGLVIAEATGVSPEGRISPKCLGLYSDENEAALARTVGFCKKYGVAKMGIQLAHAGRKGASKIILEGGGPIKPEADDYWEVVAPSAIALEEGWQIPKALDDAGIEKVKADFVQAAARADRADMDLVELHMAHGYLLHEFLSPISNIRTDRYGGSLENRMRLPLEVFDAVREVWPEDKPLGVRISATDYVEGGWDIEQSVAFGLQLKQRGCDFIDVSSGGMASNQEMRRLMSNSGPGYQVPFAARIKADTGLTTWAVGLIVEPQYAEEILQNGEADMIAIARGAMYDPRWAWHAAFELGAETDYAPRYARCSPANRPTLYASRLEAAK